jgi:hypothetical protein
VVTEGPSCDTHRTFRVVTTFTRIGRPAMAVTDTSSTRVMG